MSETDNQLESKLEITAVAKAFDECLKLLSEKAYKDGFPVMCEIHEAFGGLEGKSHNCLGCNFADSTDQIKTILESNHSNSEIKHSFPLYIMSLYFLVERMTTIMDIVSLPEMYREKYFKVFQQIRKWANFIKHPKSFILVHHPSYNFENSDFTFDEKFDIIINEQFVEKYYKGKKNPEEQKKMNSELYKLLHNKQNVVVVYPDIVQLTDKLCFSIKKFIEVIMQNDVYKEILHDEATLEHYFEEQTNHDEQALKS